jgi:hypothetical protein
MSRTVDALALLVIVAGFLLFGTSQTAMIGGLLVAGGAYALALPHILAPTASPQ